MLDANTDRMMNAIGMVMVGALLLGGALLFFGKGPESIFTQIVRGSDGHAVTYDLDGGLGEFDSIIVDFEHNDLSIPDKEPTQDSHVFVGWINSEDNQVVYPGATITVNKDIVLKAKWKASTHDIRYDLNGGSGNLPGVKLKVNDHFNLTSKLPIKEGMHLTKWLNTSTGDEHDPGDSVAITGTTVFKALWDVNEYDVTYDLDGGSKVSDYPADKKIHDKYFTVTTVNPTKHGHYFHGWKAFYAGTKDAEATVYDAGENFQVKGNVVLRASWSKSKNRIMYDLKGGAYEGSNPPPLVQYGSHGKAHKIAPNIPTKPGFTFNGWDNNRDVKTYQAGGSFTVDGDTKLDASWSETDHRISYDMNGGSGQIAGATAKHGSEYNISNTKASRRGYIFDGWINSEDNKQYKSGEKLVVQADTVLKAHWLSDRYDVSFELNGGTGNFSSEAVSFESKFFIPDKEPDFDGRHFLGWMNSSDNKIYQPANEITITQDTKLTAQWDLKDHIVEYDLNGGRGTFGPTDMSHDSNFTVSGTKPTRHGHTFTGWTNSVDTKTYQAGSTFKVVDDTTLIANWEVNTYMVEYYLNGGVGPHKTQEVKHGTEFMVSTDVPTRVGYEFKGWNNSADNLKYQAGNLVQITSNVRLTADWLLETYDVSYDLDGGFGSEDFSLGARVKYNQKYTILNEAPHRVGHNFKGWVDSETGSRHYGTDAILVDRPITLKAVWEIDEYLIRFDMNGGSVKATNEFKDERLIHGAGIVISTEEPTHKTDSNLTFMGWRDSVDDLMYDAGGQYTVAEDAVLIAQWGSSSYLLEYDEAGGTIEYDNDQPEGEKHIFEVNSKDGHTIQHTPTLDNYVFTGWESNIDGRIYQPGEKLISSKDLTLTAQYELAEYDLVYDLNGGSGSFPVETLTYDVDHKISGRIPTRRGHTFTGWTSSQDNTVISAGSTIVQPRKAITLTAKWQINRHTISYNTRGGNGNFVNGTQDYDSTYVISSVKPTRTGYTFDGWRRSDTSSLFQPGGRFQVTGDVTLDAEWSKNSYTVTYNTNGGSGYFASSTVDYGSSYRVSSTAPTRSGYQFNGWVRSDTGQTVPLANSFTVTGNVELKASWSINSHRVSYNLSNGSGSFGASTHNYGSVYGVSSNKPTRDFYTFNGWRRSDTNGLVQAGSTFTITGDVVLTAQWSLNSILEKSVTFPESTSNDQYHNITIPGIGEVISLSVNNNANVTNQGITGNVLRVNTYYGNYHRRVQTGGSVTSADRKYVTNQTSSNYNSGGYTGTLSRYVYSGSAGTSGSWVYDGTVKMTAPNLAKTKKHREPGGSYPKYPDDVWEGTLDLKSHSPVEKDIKLPPTAPTGTTRRGKETYQEFFYQGTVFNSEYQDKKLISIDFENYLISYKMYKFSGGSPDTRVYRYQGYVNRPASDTRTYQNYYKYSVNVRYRQK